MLTAWDVPHVTQRQINHMYINQDSYSQVLAFAQISINNIY